MSWWNDKQLRISAVQYKGLKHTSSEVFDEYVSECGFNTEQNLHLWGDGHIVAYDEEKHGKLLDEYLEKSNKAGIKEIIYTNIHCVNPDVYEKHPEYALLDKNKKPIMAYNDTYNFICLNGPYFEEHIKKIKALCSRDIAGIFLDGPIMRPDACYCEHCLKKFEEMYGKSRYEATYFESAEFNMKMASKFVEETNKIIKSVNPDILLYINNTLLKPDVVGVRGRETEPFVDLIGTEGGFVWVDKSTTLWHVSPLVKMAETICNGKMRVCFIAGDLKPWTYYMHTACETDIFYGQSLAYGTNIWYGIHGGLSQTKTPGGKAAETFNYFIKENEEHLINTKSTSKVALFWSDATATRYSTSVDETDFVQSSLELGENKKLKGNQFSSFKGMYDILTRAHIQFDLVDEVSFKKGDHKKYEVIILTTAACISDEISDIIREYVKSGGKIISNFDSGLYNELCEKRNISSLAEIQGVKEFKEIIEYPVGCGYLVTNKDCGLFNGVYDENIPMPGLSVINEYLPSAKICGVARMPLAGRYVHLVEETYPSLVYNKYGKGESIYFSGSMGEFFDVYGNGEYKKLMTNAVNKFSAALIETDAPGSVEVSMRKQGNKYIIHLVNLTGEMIRPIERIIPVSDVRFTINEDIDVKSIKALRGKKELSFSKENGKISFTLEKLEGHEIIVMEY